MIATQSQMFVEKRMSSASAVIHTSVSHTRCTVSKSSCPNTPQAGGPPTSRPSADRTAAPASSGFTMTCDEMNVGVSVGDRRPACAARRAFATSSTGGGHASVPLRKTYSVTWKACSPRWPSWSAVTIAKIAIQL